MSNLNSLLTYSLRVEIILTDLTGEDPQSQLNFILLYNIACNVFRRNYKGPSAGNIRGGRIILRWIFRKWHVGIWTGSSWIRIGTGGGHL